MKLTCSWALSLRRSNSTVSELSVLFPRSELEANVVLVIDASAPNKALGEVGSKFLNWGNPDCRISFRSCSCS